MITSQIRLGLTPTADEPCIGETVEEEMGGGDVNVIVRLLHMSGHIAIKGATMEEEGEEGHTSGGVVETGTSRGGNEDGDKNGKEERQKTAEKDKGCRGIGKDSIIIGETQGPGGGTPSKHVQTEHPAPCVCAPYQTGNDDRRSILPNAIGG